MRRWLLDRLSDPAVVRIWIYGSFLKCPATATDVDVMLQYEDDRTKEALALRRSVQADFRLEFGLPLHLILLSTLEVEQEAEFVASLLGSAQRLR